MLVREHVKKLAFLVDASAKWPLEIASFFLRIKQKCLEFSETKDE